MSLTDDDLIQEFERRDIALNKRVLTDWRAKGYLPPLRAKGLGQGRGKSYYWETDVVARASLVDEALQSNYRGTRILFILWLFGYDVPTLRVSEYLLSGLTVVETIARGEMKGRGAVEEHVDDLVSKYYELAVKYPQLGLSQDLAPEGLEMVLNIFANPAYELNDVPFEEGIRAVLASDKNVRTAQSPVATESERRESAEQIWRFVHEHFSLAHFRTALSEATEEDLIRVQSDIGIVFRVIGEGLARNPEVENLREMRAWAAHSFGMLLCSVDLTLRHQGWGHLVDDYLARVESGEFAAANEVKAGHGQSI